MRIISRASFCLAFGFALPGCAPRAILFHETTKVGFNAQYQPDSSQPVNFTLGYKRRIAAIVPSKETEKAAPNETITCTDPRTKQTTSFEIPKGESLSMLSRFDVVARPTGGIGITNYFVTGMAATVLTGVGDEEQVASKVRSILATPVTLSRADPELDSRRHTMLSQTVGNPVFTDEKASQMLTALKAPRPSHRNPKEALKDFISRADEAKMKKIEEEYDRIK